MFCFGLGQDDKVLGYQENYATYEQETSGGEFFVKWDEKLNVMTYEIALPISWLSDTVNSFNEKDTIALSFALRMHNGYIYEWYGGIVNRSDIKKAALFTLGKEKNMPDDSNFKVFCDRVKKLLQGENFFGLKNYKKLSMPFSTKYKSKNTFSPVSYKSGNSFLDIETIKNENTINNQLQYFVFTTENNKYLPFNISCNVEENLITAMLPAGIDCSNLIPAFVVKDGDLLIDNEKIQSGVTSIDFNDEVTLILQSYTGEKKEINVSLETLDTGLPSVAMTTENYDEIVSKEEYLNASVYVGGGAQKDPILIDAKVKGRGNTSWLSPKKSFRIKLDEKVNLLGMSTSKDWVLISNWLDKTLLRNAMAEYLAEGAGVEYVMKNHPVDLWYNGQYHGTYNLTEKIELEEERVNITE